MRVMSPAGKGLEVRRILPGTTVFGWMPNFLRCSKSTLKNLRPVNTKIYLRRSDEVKLHEIRSTTY